MDRSDLLLKDPQQRMYNNNESIQKSFIFKNKKEISNSDEIDRPTWFNIWSVAWINFFGDPEK